MFAQNLPIYFQSSSGCTCYHTWRNRQLGATSLNQSSISQSWTAPSMAPVSERLSAARRRGAVLAAPLFASGQHGCAGASPSVFARRRRSTSAPIISVIGGGGESCTPRRVSGARSERGPAASARRVRPT